jgi:hypothetical protein
LASGPLWLVVKFAENGSLIEYLQSRRPKINHSYENVASTSELTTDEISVKNHSYENVASTSDVTTDEISVKNHSYENVTNTSTIVTINGISLLEKLKFAYGIAKGMSHLAKKKV